MGTNQPRYSLRKQMRERNRTFRYSQLRGISSFRAFPSMRTGPSGRITLSSTFLPLVWSCEMNPIYATSDADQALGLLCVLFLFAAIQAVVGALIGKAKGGRTLEGAALGFLLGAIGWV